MELKISFIIFEGFFEWQKENIAIVTFVNKSLLHADKQYIYYMNQAVIDIAPCVN